jgi:hypothetical protein
MKDAPIGWVLSLLQILKIDRDPQSSNALIQPNLVFASKATVHLSREQLSFKGGHVGLTFCLCSIEEQRFYNIDTRTRRKFG